MAQKAKPLYPNKLKQIVVPAPQNGLPGANDHSQMGTIIAKWYGPPGAEKKNNDLRSLTIATHSALGPGYAII